jgi:hypothetical protein
MIDLKPIQYAGRLLQTLAQIKLKTLIIRGQQATVRRKHTPLHTTKKRFQRRDNRLQESAYRKAEASVPTKDHVGGKSGYGGGGRIAQPAGKTFGV